MTKMRKKIKDCAAASDVLIATEVCQYLWLIAKLSCSLDIVDLIQLDNAGDKDKRPFLEEICIDVVMIDLLNACSIAVANLPGSVGGNAHDHRACHPPRKTCDTQSRNR